MRRFCGVFLVLLVAASHAGAARLNAETFYRDAWCTTAGGQAEVRLPDATRVDCLTTRHAAEFDFGDKWAEGLGQALHYAANTGRRALVVLIVETADDSRYVERLRAVVEHFGLPVDVLTVGPGQ